MSEDNSEQSISGGVDPRHQNRITLNKLFYQSYMMLRAIYTAGVLGIADVLQNGPMDTNKIASIVGANPDALDRLRHVLASVGVFTEIGPRRFAISPLAAAFRSDVPGSLKPYISLYGADFSRRPADNLV